jgi:hypothetical protein
MSEHGQELTDPGILPSLESMEWEWGGSITELRVPERRRNTQLAAVNADELASLLDEAEGVARGLRAIMWSPPKATDPLAAAELPGRLEHLLTQHDVRILLGCPGTYQSALDLLLRGDAVRRAVADGRAPRLLLPSSTQPTVLETLSGHGAAVRSCPRETPILLALAGQDQGFTLTGRGSLRIDSPSPMLDTMTQLWDLLWTASSTGPRRPPGPSGPDPAEFHPRYDDREGAVLRHLALGAKDVVAAREMNVSLRTYRRYVAELMDQLGASSRFQAGAIAVRIGMLTPERARTSRGTR